MASKGQKFKRYTPEFKEKILKEYFDGLGGLESLARKHNVSPWTIKTWVGKHKQGIDVTVDHRPNNAGRKKSKNLTLEDYKERYEILKKYQAFLEARQGKK